MRKAILLTVVFAIALLSGCVQQPPPDNGNGDEVDLCEGVTCPDECQGKNYLSEGSCSEGQCSYDVVEYNSEECGANKFGLQLETNLRECTYDEYHNDYGFFFTIKNVGDVVTKDGATIWLLADVLDKKVYRTLNKEYAKHRTLWEELKWPTYPYQGQQWVIRDMNEFEEFDYKLVYCEIEDVFADWCTEEIGFVLHEGNTSDDCNITGTGMLT